MWVERKMPRGAFMCTSIGFIDVHELYPANEKQRKLYVYWARANHKNILDQLGFILSEVESMH